MGQYFTNDNTIESKERLISYTFLNENIKLFSDNGVFSKNRVDFGTNVLLNSLEDLSSVKSLLDVGCGIGTIGICIKKKYKNIHVVMIDVNERAINLAKKNIEINHLEDIEAKISNLYENVREQYDMIISNPPIRAGKQIVHGVVTDGFEPLNHNGWMYIVIQKKQGAESMKNKMEEVFGNVQVVNKASGYLILKAIKK